ncbi:hypothetical protein FML60_04110 [Klebsiella variicola]|nr:hypothetical protein [Klebsiella variicola]
MQTTCRHSGELNGIQLRGYVMPCARRSAPVQPENAELINVPIMFLRSHDEFSAPDLLAGKSEKPGH